MANLLGQVVQLLHPLLHRHLVPHAVVRMVVAMSWWGYRWRRRGVFYPYPPPYYWGWYPPQYPPPWGYSPEDELRMLEEYKKELEAELEELKEELESVNKRIEELKEMIRRQRSYGPPE